MQDKIFLISNNRLTIKEIIEKSDGLLQVSKKYDSFSLIYKKSEIIPLNEKGLMIENEDEILAGFFIVSDTYEILKYLYKKHKIMFMDQDFKTLVSYLDPVKHYKYYTNIINEYTYECMLHMGIINDIKDIEKHVYNGRQFFNEYTIEQGQIIRYKIIRWITLKNKIKNFFIKIWGVINGSNRKNNQK